MKLVCLLLLLSVAAVYETEAGWWSKAVNWVKGAVKTVVRFVGKRQRRRRQLSEDLDVNAVKEMDGICKTYHLKELSPDGIPFEMVKLAFEEIDQEGEGKDSLNAAELDKFLDIMEAFQYCAKRATQG